MSPSTLPRRIRTELLDTIEDIAQAAGLLRESITDADAGNLPGAQMCGSDALEILSSLEDKFSDLSAALCAWVNASLSHGDESAR